MIELSIYVFVQIRGWQTVDELARLVMIVIMIMATFIFALTLAVTLPECLWLMINTAFCGTLN